MTILMRKMVLLQQQKGFPHNNAWLVDHDTNSHAAHSVNWCGILPSKVQNDRSLRRTGHWMFLMLFPGHFVINFSVRKKKNFVSGSKDLTYILTQLYKLFATQLVKDYLLFFLSWRFITVRYERFCHTHLVYSYHPTCSQPIWPWSLFYINYCLTVMLVNVYNFWPSTYCHVDGA
jgi:hypothetical protein